jgi:hypothetical protein
MSSFKLKRSHKKILIKASRKKIEEYFINLPKSRRSTKWIQKCNRYRLECSERYKADCRSDAPTLSKEHLIGYVSASAPTHVIDGWAYLGRAIDSALRGDQYNAIHLGYYAELRAAMALLAGEGIAIFSRFHAVVDKDGSIFPFPNKPNKNGLGTHQAVWPILTHWAGRKRAAILIDQAVSPNSISLTRWLTAGGANVSVPAIAQQWLSTWGLDLAAFDDDHELRNLASYRPSELRKPDLIDIHETAQYVEELWQLFEPSSPRRFPGIERVLLRKAWRQSNNKNPTPQSLESIGISAVEAREWSKFLASPNDPKPLELAKNRSEIENPLCHLGVLSRAALLLFVATTTARRLLADATYTAGDLGFWWRRYGASRGLWPAGAAPEDPQDLWANIADTVGESEAWRASNPIGTASLTDWRQSQVSALRTLGGFELVGIWGLLP